MDSIKRLIAFFYLAYIMQIVIYMNPSNGKKTKFFKKFGNNNNFIQLDSNQKWTDFPRNDEYMYIYDINFRLLSCNFTKIYLVIKNFYLFCISTTKNLTFEKYMKRWIPKLFAYKIVELIGLWKSIEEKGQPYVRALTVSFAFRFLTCEIHFPLLKVVNAAVYRSRTSKANNGNGCCHIWCEYFLGENC